ncbi:hypothetical protein GGR52DRAFT_51750 [Hypoxylon sp. FL1284]|nr:hypothetical protein GGR52DRAFT_51750 [Hypoxylon sp. FL1284]
MKRGTTGPVSLSLFFPRVVAGQLGRSSRRGEKKMPEATRAQLDLTHSLNMTTLSTLRGGDECAMHCRFCCQCCSLLSLSHRTAASRVRTFRIDSAERQEVRSPRHFSYIQSSERVSEDLGS